MYNTFGLFLHKVFASTLTRYLPPLFLIVHNPKMTVQPATNDKGLTPCLQKKNSQGYDSYDYQWCCEAPTTRVPPDTHPNALGKCWGNYYTYPSKTVLFMLINRERGENGGRIFFQWLELGYEKFPPNTTAIIHYFC